VWGFKALNAKEKVALTLSLLSNFEAFSGALIAHEGLIVPVV
jgi:hypothetical protein